LTVQGIAVFALDHFLALHVVQSAEVLVVHVLDKDPLNLEIAFEF
jgi:hypothetical protein